MKKKIGTYLLLILWAIIVLFPFYWMILTSFKSYSSYNSEYVPLLYTTKPTIENYISVFKEVALGKYLLNTLIFTVCTVIMMMITTILCAYAFARLKFKGKKILFTLLLALMMIPNELVIITNYVTITNLNLRNTF